jgi:hypothetical protein
MSKLDFKKEYKELYNTSTVQPVLVDVPELQYLMIDGAGDPNQVPMYKEVVQAIYSVAYALKFRLKENAGLDYTVMPLEGLWWAEDMSRFSVNDKSNWLWTMLILQPESVTPELVAQVAQEVEKKKKLARVASVRLEKLKEDKCAQIMHIGPYAAEEPTVQKLHAFIHENGYSLAAKHHEIYLSDPNRSDPAKMRTIIRQPVTE